MCFTVDTLNGAVSVYYNSRVIITLTTLRLLKNRRYDYNLQILREIRKEVCRITGDRFGKSIGI